jgi:hypothetical protein
MFELNHFLVGYRVQLHPATDAWMMGDRYGTVTKIGRRCLHVRMDRSGRVRRVNPCNIFDIYSPRCGGFNGRDPAREGQEAAKDR